MKRIPTTLQNGCRISSLRIVGLVLLIAFAVFQLAGCKKDTPAPPPLFIAALNPTTGLPGTSVTITGTGFSDMPTNNQVYFNGVAATVSSSTNVSITATVPEGATTGVVKVVVDQKEIAGPVFTVTSLPVITSILPASGPVGTEIEIKGAHFSTNCASNIVQFNGIAATIISCSASTLVVKVPEGASSGNVLVKTTVGEVSSATAFTVTTAGGVYVSGYNAPGGVAVAMYWKDGVATALTNSGKNAHANGIWVAGNDVYVAGDEQNASNVYVAKYWKNGTATELTSGTHKAFAYGITVVGNDVYTVGSEETDVTNNYYRVAKYWKNGTVNSLTNGSKSAEALAIFIDGSDVYAAGYEANGNGDREVAKYWKNGVPMNLTDGNFPGRATSIVVIGGVIYVAGYEQNSAMQFIAKYWKNGTAVNLTDGTRLGVAKSIAVDGNDVYVAGYEANAANKSVAKYWKNGVAVSLSAGVYTAYANGIAVHGGNVYTVGHEQDAHKVYSWKNTTATELPSGAFASGVFVK